MPTDRTGEPWPTTSDDDASDRPSPPPAAEPAERWPTRPVMVLGGVAGALVLGVLFGLWAQPELITSRPTAPTVPSAVASPSGSQVPLVMAPPAKAEPPPRAPGRLETLPPEMAAAAQTQILPFITPGPADHASAEPPAATSPEAAEIPPSPRYAASFDCATARPGAEEMVCEDSALAAADRRLARAYARAMRAGVDPEDLRQEQRDWVAIREDAAMQSRQALAEVYDQRTVELNRIAEAAPPADGQ